jgi:hypothetical protein
LANLSKIITDNQKYDGTGLALDYHMTIFYDLCYRVEIPRQAYLKAFPCILKGIALSHYYSAVLPTHGTFKQTLSDMRRFFEGPAYSRQKLIK